MNARLALTTGLFLSFLFVPHTLLGLNGYYLSKLKVQQTIGQDYFFGVLMGALFLLLFLLCAQVAGLSRTALKGHAETVQRRRSFRTIMLLLTLAMLALLSIGIGAKQSTSSLNFLIRLLPRELLLVITVVVAIATWNRFWIALMALNVLYWVAIGSKASLFLVVLTLVFYHTLEGTRIKPAYLLWGGLLVLVLPVSYLLPLSIETGMSIFDLLRHLYNTPDLGALMASRLLGRVSWYDGMFLNAQDLEPMAHFTLLDFIDVTLAGFVPGMTATESPLGTQLTYLFAAGNNLENFAGAIGIPAVFKMIYYNSGLLGLAGLMLLIGVPVTGVMALTASRAPFLSLLGFATLILLMFTLFISGNVDSALGRLLPLIISGLFYFVLSRRVFLARNYRPA